MKAVDVFYTLRCEDGSSKEDNGIEITATEEISVQLINQEMYTTDGTVIFPDDSLGTQYFISTWTNYNIQVVAVEAGDTTVSMTMSGGPVFLPSGTYWAGQTATEKLKQFQTWNVVDTIYGTVDLSGSLVKADKKIAVFGGSYLASVGDGTADHLLEQMLPYNLWGKTFLLPSTPGRLIGDIFRACAAEKSSVTLSTGGTSTMNEGDCKDYDIPTGQYPVLTSDKAIQVYLYSKSFDDSSKEPNGVGDPALSMVPPIDQYINAFMFSTMSGVLDPFEYYSTAVFPLGKAVGLMWNREEISNKPGVT